MKTKFYSIASLLTLALLVFAAATAEAKTFRVKDQGKWNNPENWSPYYPAQEIIKFDTIIIEKSIILNVDLTISGLVVIGEDASLMGNKSLYMQKDAVFVNNGHTIVRTIVNDGFLTNNNMLETIEDVSNYGIINNTNSFVTGGNLQNVGGTIFGIDGQFYAGENIFNTNEGFIANTVTLHYDGLQEIVDKSKADSNIHTGMSINVKVIDTKIELAFDNPSNAPIKMVRFERSTDGFSYETAMTKIAQSNGNSLNYTDVMKNKRTYYRVKVFMRNGDIDVLPIILVDGQMVDEIENLGLSLASGAKY